MTIVHDLKGLKRALAKVKARHLKNVERGFIKAGLFLQRKSQKVVPVDTGNLRNSAFTRLQGHNQGKNSKVFVGYTAAYAIFVHEDLEASHKPGKTAKFLEGPAREHRQDMIDIILKEARKK